MQSFCNEQISVPCCVICKLAPHGFSRAGPGLPASRASRLFNYFFFESWLVGHIVGGF